MNIEQYLKEHESKTMLRFITCGSVDDGKSTLIGRLLFDSKLIYEDQLAAVENDSKKLGTCGSEIDLALLVDGLQSEREQGITIDVACRFFSTRRRKFIIADTPGHEQYTRNMATGASTAELAIILIDARNGVLAQTRRHSFIVSLLGISNVIVAINKMDLVGYSQERYEAIKKAYQEMLPLLPNHQSLKCRFVPLSALKGDNVVSPSEAMPWYNEPPLMEVLDTIEVRRSEEASGAARTGSFRFPVQYVNRPNSDFRGFCGTIASGEISPGDEITVLPSGRSTRIKEIFAPGHREQARPVERAFPPMAVTLTTSDEVDISRGDMIVRSDDLPRMSNTLKVMMIWMDESPMTPGRNYLVKSATGLSNGFIEHVNYRVDVNTFGHNKVDRLELNDIGSCKLVLSRPIAADPYHQNRITGSFVLIDRITNSTCAAGMIVDVSRRDYENLSPGDRTYSFAEIELNEFVRKHYPEWGCKKI